MFGRCLLWRHTYCMISLVRKNEASVRRMIWSTADVLTTASFTCSYFLLPFTTIIHYNFSLARRCSIPKKCACVVTSWSHAVCYRGSSFLWWELQHIRWVKRREPSTRMTINSCWFPSKWNPCTMLVHFHAWWLQDTVEMSSDMF